MVSVPTRAGSYFVSSVRVFCAQFVSPFLSCIGLEITFSSDLCTQLVYFNNWKYCDLKQSVSSARAGISGAKNHYVIP